MHPAESRLVLDTNTLISRMLMPDGIAGRAVDKALAEGVLLVSEESIKELATVLSRPKFDRYVSLSDRRAFLSSLSGVVRVVAITHRVRACRDPEADMILHVALNGEASRLITGDQDLLVLADSFGKSHRLQILSPAQYLALP